MILHYIILYCIMLYCISVPPNTKHPQPANTTYPIKKVPVYWGHFYYSIFTLGGLAVFCIKGKGVVLI